MIAVQTIGTSLRVSVDSFLLRAVIVDGVVQRWEPRDLPPPPTPPIEDDPPTSGPGAMLARIIKSITGDLPENRCGCVVRMRQMNEWGWWGCWKNRRVITGWLVEEAKKRGHDIDGNKAMALLRAAIREQQSE